MPRPDPQAVSGELQQRIKETTETSERVMAQNIALLGEVEAMQRQIAALRDEKASMARRLRILMTEREGAASAATS